jgi:glycosyltransferase involved in cell wall biosynthesis
MWSEASYRNAGISRYTSSILEALFQHRNHEFLVFTHDEYEPPDRWKALPNARFFPLVPNQRGKRALWEFFQSTKAIREHRCDVWFSTGHLIPFRSPAPRVAMIHDLIPILFPQFFEWEHAAFLRFALRNASTKAERVVTNSEATKADIVRLYGVRPDRITVTPLGPGNVIRPVVSDGVGDERLREIGVPFPRFLFALGTLEPRKNLGRLFEALSILKRDGGLNGLGLAVAGGKGWKESETFARIRELGVEEDVAFLGYVQDEDLPALFARCEAFVYPSLYEGFGMPVLEAMLAGAPVLTSDRVMMREVGGDVATYFAPESPEDIARAIREHLSGNNRSSLVEAGFQRAEAFTWSRAATLTLQAMESAVAKNP